MSGSPRSGVDFDGVWRFTLGLQVLALIKDDRGLAEFSYLSDQLRHGRDGVFGMTRKYN